MIKRLIDLIGDNVKISGNPTFDGILFMIIGVLSFFVAYVAVGWIFDKIGIYSSKLMSKVHWIIRLAVLAALTFFAVKIFQFIGWLFSFPWWAYLIIVGVFMGVVALIFYVRHRIYKNKTEKGKTEIKKHI